MSAGGGYLDPVAWYCWINPISKRLKVKLLKASGAKMLRGESMTNVKCFHASGKSKFWIVEAEKAGLQIGGKPQEAPTAVKPFVEYHRAQFDRKQSLLKVAKSLGIMKILGGHG